MSRDPIEMVKCPMCKTSWIDGLLELACSKCAPNLDIDLAVADLERVIGTLEKHPPEDLSKRIGILTSQVNRLNEVVKGLSK